MMQTCIQSYTQVDCSINYMFVLLNMTSYFVLTMIALLSKFCYKFDMILNNICKCFNNYIIEALDKPVITLSETIRILFMQCFQAKRQLLQRYKDPKYLKIQKKKVKLAKLHDMECHVTWGGRSNFEIDHPDSTFIVDLNNRICRCQMFDLIGIPCSHVVSAIIFSRKEIEHFIDHWYFRNMFFNAYKPVIKHVPGIQFRSYHILNQ